MRLKDNYSWIKHYDFMFIDLVCLMFSFIISYYLKFENFNLFVFNEWNDLFIITCSVNLLVTFYLNVYSGILRRNNYEQLIREIPFYIYQIVIICILFYVFKIGMLFSRKMMITMYAMYIVTSQILKYLRKLIILKTNKYSNKKTKILLVTDKESAKNVIQNILIGDVINYEVKYIYLTDGTETKINNIPVIKNYKNKDIEEVFIATDPSNVSKEIYKYFVENGICVHLNIENITGFETEVSQIQKVGNYTTLSLDMFSYDANKIGYFVLKRLFDIICSILGLFLILIFSIIIKISYMITGDFKSIFYTQRRIGKNGKVINIYKFRSMVYDANEALEKLLKEEKYRKEWEKNQKLENDPRITRIGKIIRKLSIDELPQFINVLKGEMSLVGPRPLVEGELEAHEGLQLYNKVKPGITGWWACNGRSNIEYRERLELEYYYVHNCSISLDLTCLFRTVLCVIKKEGAK